MKMRTVILSVCIGIIAAWTACAQDPTGIPAVPRFINYQGRLLDSEGVPRVGTFYITFSLQEPDGSEVWTEIHEVTLENDHSGLFSVLLGSSEPLELSNFPIDNDGDFGDVLRYLQVSIAEDEESDPIPLTPRKEFVSVAYAFRASDADTLDGWHSVDMTGEGWDETTTLKSAQDHIADKNNPHEVTLDQLGHVDNNPEEEEPTATERGEPTRNEIEQWGDKYDWDQDDHSQVDHSGLLVESDPQVDDNMLQWYVPKWDGSKLITGRIYDNPSKDGVGVGTDDPQSSRLHVQGPGQSAPILRLSTTGTGEKDFYFRISGPSSAYDTLYVCSEDNTDLLSIRSSGAVGVKDDLWVNGGDLYLGDDERIYRYDEDKIKTPGTFAVGERVGIGLDYPGYTLDVNGAVRAGKGLIVSSGGIDVTCGAAIRHDHDSLTLYSRASSSRYEGVTFHDSSGTRHAGIRAHTPYPQGSITGDLEIWTETAGADIVLGPAGGVGIGTDSPGDKLDVNGNASVRGQLNLHNAAVGPYPGDYRIHAHTVDGERLLAFRSSQWGMNLTVLVPTPDGFLVAKSDNSIRNIHVWEDGTLWVRTKVTVPSDSRLKTKQQPIDYGLADIMRLQPKRYQLADWAQDNETGELVFDEEGAASDIGLVAQEVSAVIPEAVEKPENENKELWSLSYDKIVPVLVKAVQEQQEQIDALRLEVERLKALAGE